MTNTANKSSIIGLILGPILFLITLLFYKPEGLSPQGVGILATAIWMAVWWVTEAIPIAVTALMPIVLFPLTGGLNLEATTAPYGHKFVFLYLGGFLVAIAIERWNLHKRIALTIINAIGTDVRKILLGFMLATAFLSMWISNTATAVMMLPIALAIVNQMKDDPRTKEDEHSRFAKSMMLAIAYSASIGGIATLIGTPPNLVLSGVVKELYGYEITFTEWLKYGLPIAILLFILCYFYLTRIAYKFEDIKFPAGAEEIKSMLKGLGKMGIEEKRVLTLFIITALLWIFRAFLTPVLPALDDTIIAIIAGLALFILPAGPKHKGEKLLNWEDSQKIPWGIILLFGGGMTLAEGFKTSGLAEFIGKGLSGFDTVPFFILVLVTITLVNFLTEITSNLATTAMILPILASVSDALGHHPYLLMIPATIAASCAFMLPVATPPNAVVFSSGHLRIPDMIKAGLFMNIASIILLFIYIYLIKTPA
ncbi:MAG: SLC13/DASS family transporter [Saprospiraceae bacterium]|nr:SLC13/DASS family transporter [Saprospiraceae bacterium]